MKVTELTKLPKQLRDDALLWQKMGHALGLLYVHNNALWVPEQYAHQLQSNSLELLSPEPIRGVTGGAVWCIKWDPVEDPTIWSGILQRYSIALWPIVRKLDSRKALSRRVIQAYLQLVARNAFTTN
jgi:hypothetical protein